MGRLADLKIEIQKVSETIRMLESALVRRPDEEGLIVNLSTLRDVRNDLEIKFRGVADLEEVDICVYRVFRAHGRESARGFATSLAIFQKLYSVVYDALKNGPKQRASLSQAVTDLTDFGFAYSSAGSIAATLTLPNEHLLFDSSLDGAIQMVFELAQMRELDAVAKLVGRLGAAPISVLYDWAESNLEFEMGTEVRWERLDKVRNRLFVDHVAMAKLAELLAAGGEPRTEERQVFGRLEGIDVGARTFKMIVAKDIVTGKLDLESPFNLDHTVEVPAMYHALLRTTSRDVYAKGETEVRHVILSLTRPTA